MNSLSYLSHITEDMWNTFANKYKLKSILVFGSIATEEFHDESDIDFAVIGQAAFTLDEKLAMELELEDLLVREIDVIDLNDGTLNIFVKIQALNEGITIFTLDQDSMLQKCIQETEYYYKINESFFKKRRKELLS